MEKDQPALSCKNCHLVRNCVGNLKWRVLRMIMKSTFSSEKSWQVFHSPLLADYFITSFLDKNNGAGYTPLFVTSSFMHINLIFYPAGPHCTSSFPDCLITNIRFYLLTYYFFLPCLSRKYYPHFYYHFYWITFLEKALSNSYSSNRTFDLFRSFFRTIEKLNFHNMKILLQNHFS